MIACLQLVSHPDSPSKKKGGSGKYSTALHLGLAVSVGFAKS